MRNIYLPVSVPVPGHFKETNRPGLKESSQQEPKPSSTNHGIRAESPPAPAISSRSLVPVKRIPERFTAGRCLYTAFRSVVMIELHILTPDLLFFSYSPRFPVALIHTGGLLLGRQGCRLALQKDPVKIDTAICIWVSSSIFLFFPLQCFPLLAARKVPASTLWLLRLPLFPDYP